MIPPRIPHKSTVASAAAFRTWLRGAEPDDWCVWHIGDGIARERRANPKLDELVDCVRVFGDLGAVTQVCQRVKLAVGPRSMFVAIRTRSRLPPRALLIAEIKPLEFFALRALDDRDRNSRMGAPRVLRDTIALPEDKGRTMLESLLTRGLVERDQFGGWQVTDAAREIIR